MFGSTEIATCSVVRQGGRDDGALGSGTSTLDDRTSLDRQPMNAPRRMNPLKIVIVTIFMRPCFVSEVERAPGNQETCAIVRR